MARPKKAVQTPDKVEASDNQHMMPDEIVTLKVREDAPILPVKQEKITVTVQTPSQPSRLSYIQPQQNNTVRVQIAATGIVRTMNRKDAERLTANGAKGYKIL